MNRVTQLASCSCTLPVSQVPILATLSDYERLTIADALVQEEFPKGTVICVQGEPGNKFYIVEKVG